MNIQTYKMRNDWKSGDEIKPDKTIVKEQAHDSDLLHLSTHLLLIDNKGKICCRKRPKDDFRYADLWTTTIGTHVLMSHNYQTTLEPLLPRKMDLKWIGEFRVHDDWENEINGLFISGTDKKNLPAEFLKGRTFLAREELEASITQNKTTPHLAEAYKLLTKSGLWIK